MWRFCKTYRLAEPDDAESVEAPPSDDPMRSHAEACAARALLESEKRCLSQA